MYLTKNLLLNQKIIKNFNTKSNIISNKEIFLKEKQLYSVYNTYLAFIYNFADFSKFLDNSFIFGFLNNNSQLTNINLIELLLLLQNIKEYYKLSFITKDCSLLNEYLLKLKANSYIKSNNLFEFYFIKKFISSDLNISLNNKQFFFLYIQNYLISFIKIQQINNLITNNIYKSYNKN